MSNTNLSKKTLAVLLAAAMVLPAAACSPQGTASTAPNPDASDASEASSASEEETPQEPVSLSMMWMGGDTANEMFVPMLQAWNEENPLIQVTGELYDTDSEEKIRMTLASGTAPDILMLGHGWVPGIVAAGDYLCDFNEQDILDLSGFDEAAMKDFGEYDGKQVALPASYATITLCANLTDCERLGVEIEDDLTIDELYEKGRALHEAHPEAYLYIVHEVEVWELFQMLLKQEVGGSLFNEDYTVNFTQDQLEKIYNVILEGYESGTFQPLAEAVASSPDGACLLNTNWVSGNGLMVSNASGGIIYSISFVENNEQKEFGMFTLPKLTEDNTFGNGVLTCEKMWAVSSASQHQDQAFTFLDYLVNSTEAVDFLQGETLGGVYATKTQFEYAAENGFSNPYITEAYEKVISRAQPVSNAISVNTDLVTILQDELMKVCYLSLAPADAAAETMPLLESKLQQLQSEANA